MTSVLSRRWRYLCTSAFSTLEFKDRDIATGKILMKRVKFKSWVNCVLKAYQAHPINLIDNLIIRFLHTAKRFHLPLGCVVHLIVGYILLCKKSWFKENVLKLLEIPNLRELNLGDDFGDSLIFEPNQHSSYSVQIEKLVLDHRILTRGRANIAVNPDLPRLCSLKRLELKVYSLVSRSLLFFTPLIKASPQLHEFRIELIYIVECWDKMQTEMIPYPALTAAETVTFNHKSLKVIEMAGYVGCSSEQELLLQLFKIAASLERVVIDTKSNYYDDTHIPALLSLKEYFEGNGSSLEIGATTRIESKERAHHMLSTLPPWEIDFVVM
ncbi:hypothetical protein PHJA_002105400 [Phtheirospermum japonicum]|uniref:FBD domain-containing protein n=1 Tax=Phtheirospermum japonicum TaxID=374723 RepID=A0A830CUV7_9LAMI|nr:hypothetical protein PHJA_002105400 [Phtheirospermum japonicum]